jgi:hypothetical protein
MVLVRILMSKSLLVDYQDNDNLSPLATSSLYITITIILNPNFDISILTITMIFLSLLREILHIYLTAF